MTLTPRTIAIVTVGRSDYSILFPVLKRIERDRQLKLHLMVSGMHLSPEFGLSVKVIEADGFQVGERIEMLLSADTPEGIAKSTGLGVIGFAQAFARLRPDILLVLGDRFEMYAAALAALPFKIAVAHIHGGELTRGAIDDALRHSITKLSHLHFVSTEEYARRVKQLGEESWRVRVCGAPSLDNLQTLRLLNREELANRYGLHLDSSPLLVTYHPVTLEYEETEWQVGELLGALSYFRLPMVVTRPNADTNGRVISRKVEEFAKDHPWVHLVENLGPQGYFSLMACASAVVGNSSSGIIEAPSFGLPAVNIGIRQQGRVRAANVIDVGYGREEIRRGIEKALLPEFRARLQDLPNPYGNGYAADIIVDNIKRVALDDALIIKRFVDLPIASIHEQFSQAS